MDDCHYCYHNETRSIKNIIKIAPGTTSAQRLRQLKTTEEMGKISLKTTGCIASKLTSRSHWLEKTGLEEGIKLLIIMEAEAHIYGV